MNKTLTDKLFDLLASKPCKLEELQTLLHYDKEFRTDPIMSDLAVDFTAQSKDQKPIFKIAASLDIEIFKLLYKHVFKTGYYSFEVCQKFYEQAFNQVIRTNNSAVFDYLLKKHQYVDKDKKINMDQHLKGSRRKFRLQGETDLISFLLLKAMVRGPAEMLSYYTEQLLFEGANSEQTFTYKTPNLTQTIDIAQLIDKLPHLKLADKQTLLNLLNCIKKINTAQTFHAATQDLQLFQTISEVVASNEDFFLRYLKKSVSVIVANSHAEELAVDEASAASMVESEQNPEQAASKLSSATFEQFIKSLISTYTYLAQFNRAQHWQENKNYKLLQDEIVLELISYQCHENGFFATEQERKDFIDKSLLKPLLEGATYEDTFTQLQESSPTSAANNPVTTRRNSFFKSIGLSLNDNNLGGIKVELSETDQNLATSQAELHKTSSAENSTPASPSL